MVIIKLSTPDWPINFYGQTPGGKGVFGNYHFEANTDCKICDYWIIWGGLLKEETVTVDPKNIIYVTDEAHDQRFFNSEFLSQFNNVAKVRKDIVAKNIFAIHEFAPWYFDKSLDFLNALHPPKKTKNISVISSNLIWLPGHKKRFDFVNSLIKHFKDKIDVYGRGFNEIPDKYEGLIDYKYSVAIENNCIPGYFTEKISECYLTYTMPIYYGCPNIESYYDKNSMMPIDINYFEESFRKLEELIDTDPYEQNLPDIISSREKFLNSYHFFPAMVKLVERVKYNKTSEVKPLLVKLLPEIVFSQTRLKDTKNNIIIKAASTVKKFLKKLKT